MHLHRLIYEVNDRSLKKANIQIFRVDFNGLYVERKGGKTFIHSYDFDPDTEIVVLPNEKGELRIPKQKPIEISPDNTLLFSRGLGTGID